MYYNWFRFYDPKIGRYLRTDPLRFRGDDFNFYSYVGNNVVNTVDVMGLRACPCECDESQKDLQKVLNDYINKIIQDAGGDPIAVFNELVPATYYKHLPAIEEWIDTHQKEHLTGLYDDVRRVFIAPCMRLCGRCVGVDKIGHFFEEGWIYKEIAVVQGDPKYARGFGEWLEGLVPADPAVLEWIKTTEMTLSWAGGTETVRFYDLFGISGDATLSANKLPVGKADLEANLAGLSFWEDLEKNGTAFIFDICNYVTDKWDEHLNPNVAPDTKPEL